MSMLIRRHDLGDKKVTKLADVTPVAKPEVEKKATRTKKAEKPEA